MCFQRFNLFPHLSILERCRLAQIWVRKTPKKEAEEIAMHFLENVKVPGRVGVYAAQTSDVRRPATAGGDCSFAVYASAHHTVGRADLGA